jgi:predicted deacetylase
VTARYLIRFDDLCPTMNWKIWTAIESILLEFNVHPILAVVPDNQDQGLEVDPPRTDFWSNVRQWQARGWSIGLHGYQHLWETEDAGIVGIARRSEFAGLSETAQQTKLQNAIAIFHKEGITPDVWVAPAHSFDKRTVTLLKRIGLSVISDGFALAPYRDSSGLMWVPQQLWKFRWRPSGVWTVCFHHNHWTSNDVVRFQTDLHKYCKHVTNLQTILAEDPQRRHGVLDNIYASAHMATISLRRQIGSTA